DSVEMARIHLILLLISFPIFVSSLKCHKGMKYLGVQSLNEVEECDAGKSCIFHTAKVNAVIKLQYGGCSKWRCKGVGKNTCGTLMGFPTCCCDNEDFCTTIQKNDSFAEKAKSAFKEFFGQFGKK
ncbi:hypothetical protein PFISCL1PPCAC_26324, partial [Pristionchus fissidentatus]